MNNNLSIAICEDLDDDSILLQDLIKQDSLLTRCEIFKSGEALLSSFYMGKYDLIFMDIYMEGMQGIEAVRAIREIDLNVVVAFTTSSPDYTRESYRLGALKYLEKPVNIEGVRESLKLALLKREERPSVNLLSGGKNVRIPINDIIYLEVQNHAVKIHTFSSTIQASQTVKIGSIEAQLPSPPFYRCHHSFLINMRHVREVDTSLRCFIMENGDKAFIRLRDLKRMKEEYENYIFTTSRSMTHE